MAEWHNSEKMKGTINTPEHYTVVFQGYQDSWVKQDRNVGWEALSSPKIISACKNASQVPLIIPSGGCFFSLAKQNLPF